MKILVIGGAGYIGSHVCKALREADFEIGVYDNLSSGLKENLLPETRFFQEDILDEDAVLKVMREGWNGVIHLAAFKAAGESMVHPEKYAKNNLCGTVNILNGMSSCSISGIVFSSSAAVYGEPQYLPIDEEHPVNPENFYGFTKLEIERLLAWYNQLKNIKYASLRYFNAAGYDPDGIVTGLESNPANLLPIVMETAAGIRKEMSVYGDDYPTPDGTCIRDYIHVTDLADAHVRSMKHILDSSGTSLTLNLGSGQGISVTEMIELARKITGKKIPAKVTGRRSGDPAKLVASSESAKQKIGWVPRHSDGETLITTTWKVYQNN
ncbi:MAG: UDP-glucose 4-epimerase GalE [Spirochaetia bacterium]